MAGQTKTKAVQQSRTSKTVINKDAKVKNIKSDPEGTKYRCSTCGKYFTKQKNKFFISHSMTYEGNNGYITVCKGCTEKYFTYLVEVFSGNEEKALDRICSVFDWYYNDDIAASSRKISADQSRLASYVRQMNLVQNKDKGSTYLDTIRDRSSEMICSLEDYEELKENGDGNITNRQMKRWGLGYTPEEYTFLDDHYKLLKGQISDDDVVQENLIRDLCSIKILQNRAIQGGDADSYEKFTKLYQSTLKAANLKPKCSDSDVSNDDNACWGVFIKDIEDHSPAEVYMDKKIFDDVDGIKDYFKRFIVRPFKNFFTGSNEMDEEFSIMPGGDSND